LSFNIHNIACDNAKETRKVKPFDDGDFLEFLVVF